MKLLKVLKRVGVVALLIVGLSVLGPGVGLAQREPSQAQSARDAAVLTELQAFIQQVSTSLEAGRIEEARTWYFRGLVRAGVENALGTDYAVEGYNILARGNPGFPRIMDADLALLATELDAAIEWEANTPIERRLRASERRQLPAARQSVAAYFREGFTHERAQRDAIAAVDAQIAIGPVTDEALAIAALDTSRRLRPLGSVRVACECWIDFVGDSDRAPGVGNNGTTAAVRTCDEIILINVASGDVLQRFRKEQYDNNSLTAAPSGDGIRLVLLTDEGQSNGRQRFIEITADHGARNLDMALPASLGEVGVSQSAASSDGRILALELRSRAFEGSRFAAFDLATSQLIWQANDFADGRHRLLWRVERAGDSYRLVSEVRPARDDSGPTRGEYLDLTTGTSTVVDYHDLTAQTFDPSRPTCGLREREVRTGQGREFDHVLAWSSGQQIVLSDPPRTPIQSCTTSADGRTLLVSAPPFIHRFQIESD